MQSSDPGGGAEPRKATYRAVLWLLTIIAVASGVALLHLGQDLLAPLAIASLLYVLITALRQRLGHVKVFGRAMPRGLTYLVVLGLFGVVAVSLANVIAGQVEALSSATPRYVARFEQLSDQLGRFLGPELMASINAAVAEADVSQAVGRVVDSASATFGAASLVVLFLAFLLVDTGALQRKLPLLVPDQERRANVSTALDSMNVSVQNYMWIKTLVSLLIGALSYVVMKMVGLDFAETWAVLIFLLNFIPTIGSIIGTVLPAIAALVQFPGVGPVLIVLGGIGAVQFIIGNIIEPTLSSRTLNLSPIVIILSLSFWSAIWGIPGAFLSVPLTVCIAIICSHVPPLRPLAILLAGRIPTADGAAPRRSARRKIRRRE
jgi:predicted PurR-regulated permease PerM